MASAVVTRHIMTRRAGLVTQKLAACGEIPFVGPAVHLLEPAGERKCDSWEPNPSAVHRYSMRNDTSGNSNSARDCWRAELDRNE